MRYIDSPSALDDLIWEARPIATDISVVNVTLPGNCQLAFVSPVEMESELFMRMVDRIENIFWIFYRSQLVV